jgi:CheY-like chemotaxis protein
MPTAVLICDDSGLARKQLARSLPPDWDLQAEFAADGSEALSRLRTGGIDLLLLDLNMPILDGFEVLRALQEEAIPVRTIVVSGDIQPESRRRVMELGAAAFVRKPIDTDALVDILHGIGLTPPRGRAKLAEDKASDPLDGYREIANVAMGRAADLVARMLDVFVLMPIPRVGHLEVSELEMAILHLQHNARVTGVCQGFVGFGIAGEALLLLNESSLDGMARIMGHSGPVDASAETEIVVDLAGILTGACLQGLAEQLDIGFSQNHPVVLGRHMRVSELLARAAKRWRRTLAVELDFLVEGHDIQADLLLLFSDASVPVLRRLVDGITGG